MIILYGLHFLEKIPVEPVVPNVLKFDILLPEIYLANAIHGGFGHSWRPLNIVKFERNHGLTVCMVLFLFLENNDNVIIWHPVIVSMSKLSS